MLIVMIQEASVAEIACVAAHVEQMDCHDHIMRDEGQAIIGVSGSMQRLDRSQIAAMPGIQEFLSTQTPFKRASREFHSNSTEVVVGDVTIGGGRLVVMARPCAVESLEQMSQTAIAVRDAGACILQGGAFKPRTSPYSFQGLEQEGLKILNHVRRATGLPVASEVTQPELVSAMSESGDILQIGA